MENPAIGVCIVTFKRPKLLIKMLSQIKERTLYKNYKIYAIIDYEEDDRTFKELQKEGIVGKLPLDRSVEENGKIKKIEMFASPQECVRATNRCYSVGDEPYFVWLSDDMEVEKNWLREAMKCMQTFPDGEGLVVFKDGVQNGRNACAGLISRNYIKTKLRNIFYNEIYRHFSADTELFARSKSVDGIKYCPNSVVWHNHWGAKGKHKSEKDIVYTQSRHLLKEDRETLRKRAKEGFK